MFVAIENVRDHLSEMISTDGFAPGLIRLTDYASSKPLWMKLTFGTGMVSYLYLRYRWTALNDCGVEVIEPRIVSKLNWNDSDWSANHGWQSFVFVKM